MFTYKNSNSSNSEIIIVDANTIATLAGFRRYDKEDERCLHLQMVLNYFFSLFSLGICDGF